MAEENKSNSIIQYATPDDIGTMMVIDGEMYKKSFGTDRFDSI